MDDIELSVCMSNAALLNLAKAPQACDMAISQLAVAVFTDYVLRPSAKAAVNRNKRKGRFCYCPDGHYARG